MPLATKTIEALQKHAEEIQQHPFLTPIEVLRVLYRIYEHQKHEGLGHRFQVGKLGELLGLTHEVRIHAYRTAQYEVERAYRAGCGGLGYRQVNNHSSKVTRYVIQDPDGRNHIVTY